MEMNISGYAKEIELVKTVKGLDTNNGLKR